MNLQDLLSPELVIADLTARDKNEVIRTLAQTLKMAHKISDEEAVFQAVMERENIMSTGIGNGVAIPHGKSDTVKELACVLGINKKGVNFEALDEQPVSIFFMLVSPPHSSGPHIRALAHISRLLKREAFRKALVAATTSQQALSIIAQEEARQLELGSSKN